MGEPSIETSFGRVAFGADPGGYDAARPRYPEWVFDELRERCGLRPGCATFEIGAGTGIATRRLLELGASPLLAIEPDARLARFLRDRIADSALTVSVSAFEDFAGAPGGFDLGVSATAFHWLDEDAALAKVAEMLRPGGWWATVWNVFGDNVRPDAFHEATRTVFGGPPNGAAGPRGVPFALDAEARIAALERSGAFEAIAHRTSDWTIELDAEQVVALYATFSNITVRPDREAVLAELGRIAREEFHGRVIRNMTTSLYIARRR